MSILHHKFGQTTIAKVSNSDELRQMLIDPWFKSETIILKPNWVSNEPADFTDSETLRTMFEALDSNIIVTESHHLLRIRSQRDALNLPNEGMSFNVGDKEVNWKWLLKGDGWNWLIENPDWNWVKRGGHWEQIKKEDKIFLDEYGFSDLFKEFNVSYINVTEEVWSGRIADPTEVKKSVETRFKPVKIDKLYSMVPKKLYDLRRSTFISFAKLKHYPTFTIKNLFGMIPDPCRPWWHGPQGSKISSSILDINKVYHSLFNVYGICEALYTTAIPHPEGKIKGTYGGKYNRYNIIKNLGVVAFGRDLVSLDAILCKLAGFDFKDEEHLLDMDMAEEEFGSYNREVLQESKMKVGNWLSP